MQNITVRRKRTQIQRQLNPIEKKYITAANIILLQWLVAEGIQQFAFVASVRRTRPTSYDSQPLQVIQLH
jgi:hypothetical protein